jgi:hypothetical protein
MTFGAHFSKAIATLKGRGRPRRRCCMNVVAPVQAVRRRPWRSCSSEACIIFSNLFLAASASAMVRNSPVVRRQPSRSLAMTAYLSIPWRTTSYCTLATVRTWHDSRIVQQRNADRIGAYTNQRSRAHPVHQDFYHAEPPLRLGTSGPPAPEGAIK